MKKLLIVGFMFVLLFSGCKKSPDVTLVTSGLEFTANVNISGEEYEYLVKVITPSYMIFETLIPQKIKGTVTEIKDEEVKLIYGELTQKTELSSLDENSHAVLIYNAFKYSTENKVEFEENEYFITSKEEKFKFYLSEIGIPLKIVYPEKDSTIIIKKPIIKTS